MKSGDLKKRWGNTEHGLKFIKELTHTLPSGTEITVSPFGLFEGRIDLRGLQLPREIRIRNLRIHNADLSNSSLSGSWIESSSFSDVLFNDASLKDIADHGNSFTNCDFIGSDLRQAALGYRGSQYNNVRFTETDFRKAVFIRPEFNNIDFTECRLDGIDFNASSFSECNFRGPVKEVWFRGNYAFSHQEEQFGPARKNKMKNVSFFHANLDGVTFSNHCDLSSVILPQDSSCIKYENWPKQLIRLINDFEYKTDDASKEVMIFAKAHLIHAETQQAYILSKHDLINDYGAAAASIILEKLTAT